MELDDKMSMYSTRDESSSRTASKKEYRGQIIIDAYSYLRTADTMIDEPPLGSLIVMPHGESDCLCQVCRRSPVITWRDKEVPKKATKEQFELFAASPDRLMMCPPRVLGYALKSKTWAQFRIRSCKDAISEQKSYFAEQLQLKDDYKKMLLAVVNSHRGTLRSAEAAPEDAKASLPRSLDVIEGKGKGLAILLHGPPGVGKTLTAESIALATGRSLLTVSVAEIGTAADWAEDRLNIFFVLAARWGAILLVDEADVFLEERTQNDGANRNALVSVLLRCLEYYEGIIFLTTNRITSIDVAVQSRMHIAIQFENLKADQRYAIYKYHLDKVPDVKIKGDRDRLYSEVKSRFCRKRQALNGRQIRNIVSTALSLAGDRERNPDENGPSDGKLRISDLERVHETTTDFLESMKDTMDKWRRKNEALGEDD
ncbi:hypothetical protein CERZMDRAFT_70316 [Cercospora zeae-maydis SCOH1-5]|uniref:AAA+ ATPase domain-containing protein n=1 Tax=Cercospora zeae-maydis SCOH1-5 TaxID=717836 RepID=A0A6A6F5Y2_9PEZI|nr:hypothetical protein CERZMDRAFT_70316 [Cercospora zeae-maydis SCOH1-5]